MNAAQKMPPGVTSTMAAAGGAGLGDNPQTRTNYSTRNTNSQYPNLKPARIIEAKLKLAADLLEDLERQNIHGCGIVLLWHIRQDGRCTCGKQDCDYPGKHPVAYIRKIPICPHGYKNATRDLGELRRWLNFYPYANLGLVLGPRLGAVDVDPRNGGTLDALPLTPAQRYTLGQDTGGGGDHLIYILPAADPGTQWKSKGKLGDGIDFLTDVSYIVLAGSNHISGGRYAWKPDQGPGEVEILPIPPALLSILPVEGVTAATPRPASPASADLSARFEWLLGELIPDFDATKRQGLVCCPFHDDEHPSFSYNLDRVVSHCFAPGCPAHDSRGGRGGLRGLAALAKREHGLVIPWERRATVKEQEPAPNVARSQLVNVLESCEPEPPPAPRALPWDITAADWHSCPICSAWHHSARATGGGLALRLHHHICGQRECTVSAKARAHDLLDGIENWASIHTATVAPSDWNNTRLRLRRAGARWLRIPTANGIVALCDRPDVLPGAAPTTDLEGIFTSVCASEGRVSRAHEKTRLSLETVVSSSEREPVIACEPGKRLETLSATMNATETPSELIALARSLTISSGLPPDVGDMVRAAWARCGLVMDGNRATATLEQGRALLGEIQGIRDMIRERVFELSLYGGGKTDRDNSNMSLQAASAPSTNSGKPDSHKRLRGANDPGEGV